MVAGFAAGSGPRIRAAPEEFARAEKAEQRATWWENVGEQFAALSARHREETDESTTALAAAEEHTATVRAETTVPLEARAADEARESALRERQRQLPYDQDHTRSAPRRDGPARGL